MTVEDSIECGVLCRKPTHGVNFVIAHDGFTLYDLVAYNEKHNDANGELGSPSVFRPAFQSTSSCELKHGISMHCRRHLCKLQPGSEEHLHLWHLPACAGEGNRDGTNDNFSWNCGCEGETSDAAVNALRARQIRNLHVALMVSQGMPMVLMGARAHDPFKP